MLELTTIKEAIHELCAADKQQLVSFIISQLRLENVKAEKRQISREAIQAWVAEDEADMKVFLDAGRTSQSAEDFWRLIQQRPEMFLGRPSISALWNFLNGWCLACTKHGLADEALSLPADFHEWVAYRLRFHESTTGWCRMILERALDEAEGLKMFFQLKDDHRTRVPTAIAHIEKFKLPDPHADRAEVVGSRMTLISYTTDPGFFVLHETQPTELARPTFYPCLSWFETFTGCRAIDLEIIDPARFDQVARHDV
ncbi:MAG TPA: hypothetical protein DIT13_09735 [Verrucomicrobiales bacterium]|nr:hypothetical protein [Verrucomicrobiales bacterium]HRJ09950.1 hypothetical protein [Prosthecobacter sp.]HRK13128.1 hypothetical protein [Prosthecobacter sp.]